MTVCDWWDPDFDAAMQQIQSAIQGLTLRSGTFYGETRTEAQNCRRCKSTLPSKRPRDDLEARP